MGKDEAVHGIPASALHPSPGLPSLDLFPLKSTLTILLPGLYEAC